MVKKMSDFKTKGIYASGMVLQRMTKNCIFGEAPANAEINLVFGSLKCKTLSDPKGNWKIEFETGGAGGPFVLELSCQNQKITFNDVYIGEVWISSGQSNAELPMERMKFSYPDEFNLPENPYIRMCTVPIAYNFDGEQDSVENPVWNAANSQTLGKMAGTGYFFAKKLSQDLKVPVGIINVAQGGSPIASWLNKKSLQEMENQQKLLEELTKWENPENIVKEKNTVSENQKKWDTEIWNSDEGNNAHWEKLDFSEIKKNWQPAEIPGEIDVLHSAGIVWFKKEIELSAAQVLNFNTQGTNLWLGTIIDADRVFVNGVQVGITYYSYPPRRYSVPAGLLHEGKNTITVRIQKNSKYGNIRFYNEKPYALFTANLPAEPSVCHNLESVEGRIICGAKSEALRVRKSYDEKKEERTENSEYISLQGEWKMSIGCKVEDCPPSRFFEWVPTALYNSMLAPCFNYAVAGALWYQGESDAYDALRYKKLLLKMIMLWRSKFTYAPKDMPFVIMQLPNWSDGYDKDPLSENIGWPAMRQTQLLVSEIAGNTGLAVTIDAGEWNDLHPEKKFTAGTRAAIEALRIAYNKPYNPSPKAVFTQKQGRKILIQFECGTATLKSGKIDIPGFYFLEESENNGKKTVNKLPACGKIISDNEVEVEIPEHSGKLKEIRYLWADSPKAVELYSTDNLPAAPFCATIPE